MIDSHAYLHFSSEYKERMPENLSYQHTSKHFVLHSANNTYRFKHNLFFENIFV